MIVQYHMHTNFTEELKVVWRKWTGKCFAPISSAIHTEYGRMVIDQATYEIAGLYMVTVSNNWGQDEKPLWINVARKGEQKPQTIDLNFTSTICDSGP
ncbi:unnamed protein product [Rotaria sp. Silwood2]|nr:unnamed protein product [Rotaria sp. Silwood2]CAF2771261.1 unnamed protein product [Rotaria sp. Silwood2]CAF3002280.1 unnamed protein product [Rotaria sp. Silwood2]CAF3265949.1 unnamed protein product [Rotaria sp. Silwood2]CAF3872039.1 unnamed protein product [Rotaria sp. Silwood2]